MGNGVRSMIQNNFKIIIPAYNAAPWIQKCIWSLHNQAYTNWKSVIIDDASTDQTLEYILSFMKDIPEADNYKRKQYRLLQRNVNVGALENIVYGINLICDNDEDIIVLLDGDDLLAAHDILEYLNEVYQNQNIWLTYGQYIHMSDNKTRGMNKPLTMSTREYRDGKEYWCTSHLRTFKYKVWKQLKDADLRMSNGKYYPMAWDLAIMYPLVEMCGNRRIQFINKIMYIYNDTNPISDGKKNPIYQISLAREIKNKPKYPEL